MAISTDILVRQYFNVVVGVEVAVDYPLYDELEVRVLYGLAGLTAIRNTDYEVHLGADFQTFGIVPLQSLIDKIDALTVINPLDVNEIIVRRFEVLTTSATPAAVRDTTFTSSEFDRVWMKLQEVQEQLNRVAMLDPTNIRSTPVRLVAGTVGQVPAWDVNGNLLPVNMGSGGSGTVTSVNTHTGVVVLNPDDLDDTTSTHKFTSAADIAKLAGIGAGANVTSVAGRTGVVTLAKADVGLANVDNTSDATKNSAAVTLLNKIIDASLNTISNITTAMFAANVVDTDATLAANSNTRLPSQAAIKAYVDGKVTGVAWKQSVRAATTANGTLATAYANGQTVDGVVLATGDRIFLKNQTTAADNGIYTVNASGAPTRALDADSGAELKQATAFVEEGTTNADTGWVVTNNGIIVVGTTAITVAQFSGAGTYTASGGLGISGNVISITDAILTAFRGVSAAANQLAYFTGASAMAVTSLTAFGISLIGAANAAAVKTLLSLTPGTDVQTQNATLQAIATAGNVPNANLATMAANTVKANNTAGTAAPTDVTNAALKTAMAFVKGDVGLGNVDNTSDATKNAAAVTLTNKTLTSPVVNSPTGIVKGDVGLGNVDNTSDATKRQTVFNRQTANYTLVLTDVGKQIEMNVAGANTLTVPPNSSVAIPIGETIEFSQYGAGQTTITPGAAVTLRMPLTKTRAQYSVGGMRKVGTDEWYVWGDLA